MSIRRLIISIIPESAKKPLRTYFKFQPQAEYFKTPVKVVNTHFDEFYSEVIKKVQQNPNPIINQKTINPKLQRGLDLFLASLMYLPAQMVIGTSRLILKISDPQYKTIYQTKRIGQFGKMVNIKKLHSMESLPDGVHLMSKFAIFMRKHGIDELMQIENVLKGDFSFMGPRPMDNKKFFYLGRLYGPDFLARRLRVKPGFGFGYEKGRIYPDGKTLMDLEKEKFENYGFKTYLKTIWALTKTVLKGHNQ